MPIVKFLKFVKRHLWPMFRRKIFLIKIVHGARQEKFVEISQKISKMLARDAESARSKLTRTGLQ